VTLVLPRRDVTFAYHEQPLATEPPVQLVERDSPQSEIRRKEQAVQEQGLGKAEEARRGANPFDDGLEPDADE
jgi:hypothetical protein